jgi:hypothetical protein
MDSVPRSQNVRLPTDLLHDANCWTEILHIASDVTSTQKLSKTLQDNKQGCKEIPAKSYGKIRAYFKQNLRGKVADSIFLYCGQSTRFPQLISLFGGWVQFHVSQFYL